MLANAGEICSDEGFKGVETENQCLNGALDTIKTLHPGAGTGVFGVGLEETLRTMNLADCPTGCVFFASNKMVFWNNHLTGARNSKYQQICANDSNGK